MYIMKVCSNTLFIHCDKIQTLRKFLLDNISVTKKALFSLSGTPTHHSFIFDPQFLTELKHKVLLNKSLYGIFHFCSRFGFSRVHFFVQPKA